MENYKIVLYKMGGLMLHVTALVFILWPIIDWMDNPQYTQMEIFNKYWWMYLTACIFFWAGIGCFQEGHYE